MNQAATEHCDPEGRQEQLAIAPGSGTAATPFALDSAAACANGVPASEGSNTNVPPAPTVKLVPVGRAPPVATISVPSATVVPPS